MNWTIGRRIGTGFAIVLALLLVVASIGMVSLRSAVGDYDSALIEARSTGDRGVSAESLSRDANQDYLRYLLSGSEEYERASAASAEQSRRLLQTLRDDATTDRERAAWSDALARIQEWIVAETPSVAAMRRGDRAEAVRLWETEARPARVRLSEAIDRSLAESQANTEARTAATRLAARRMQLLLLLGSGLALLLGIASALLLHRAVTGPLRETTAVLTSSAAEILAASTQQAASMSETSAAVVQTSTTIDEVAQTSEHAADRARAVADSARRAALLGEDGRRSVEESVAAMASVQEQVESIAASILALAEQAQAIGEITATVSDIAELTNLLALNAAVEAARAGEQGRGFGVVASEVRRLAEQSKAATVQVRQILGEIQRATGIAVMTTERGTQQVVTGSRQIGAAGEMIRSLAEAVSESSQASAQIVASSGQQATGMAQIRQAMQSIQVATTQSLASTRQAEQAARDLNALGGRLVALVGRDGVGRAPRLREGRM